LITLSPLALHWVSNQPETFIVNAPSDGEFLNDDKDRGVSIPSQAPNFQDKLQYELIRLERSVRLPSVEVMLENDGEERLYQQACYGENMHFPIYPPEQVNHHSLALFMGQRCPESRIWSSASEELGRIGPEMLIEYSISDLSRPLSLYIYLNAVDREDTRFSVAVASKDLNTFEFLKLQKPMVSTVKRTDGRYEAKMTYSANEFTVTAHILERSIRNHYRLGIHFKGEYIREGEDAPWSSSQIAELDEAHQKIHHILGQLESAGKNVELMRKELTANGQRYEEYLQRNQFTLLANPVKPLMDELPNKDNVDATLALWQFFNDLKVIMGRIRAYLIQSKTRPQYQVDFVFKMYSQILRKDELLTHFTVYENARLAMTWEWISVVPIDKMSEQELVLRFNTAWETFLMYLNEIGADHQHHFKAMYQDMKRFVEANLLQA
jgi:hypothetical protein